MKDLSLSTVHLTLRAHGLSPSAPRVLIYEWLNTHPVHPTIDTIYQALRPKVKTLSRTTVYNVLHAFVDKGLAEIVRTEDGELRYDGNVKPHAHFKCTRCGALMDLDPISDAVHQSVGAPEGCQIDTATVTLWGACQKCAQRYESQP